MRLQIPVLSNIQKFLLAVSVIFIVAILDYKSFVSKSAEIEEYDDLHVHVSALRVSINKLEYLLDMFSAARNFEGTSVGMVKEDVIKLEEAIAEIYNEHRYVHLMRDHPNVQEQMAKILDDWNNIREEMKRLNAAMAQDEIILLHNAVDVNTTLMTEKIDILLSALTESRTAHFEEIKIQAFYSIIGFVVLTLLTSLVFHRRVLSALNRAARDAQRMRDGVEIRFGAAGERSVVGQFLAQVNRTMDHFSKQREAERSRMEEIGSLLKRRTIQVEGVFKFLSFSGRTINSDEVCAAAVAGAVADGGASWAAFYSEDGGEWKARAWSGAQFPHLPDIPAGEYDRERASIVNLARDGAARGALASVLKGAGYSTLLVIPVSHGKRLLGFACAAYVEELDARSGERFFIEAISSGIALVQGHALMLKGELDSRRFFERLVQQMPVGVAVFGKSGECAAANAAARRLIGADRKPDFLAAYRLFDDEVFTAQGISSSLKKAFEGYATEFVINYNPAMVKSAGLNGPARRLKIRAFPVYDAEGEISNIALVYEDASESAARKDRPQGPGIAP